MKHVECLVHVVYMHADHSQGVCMISGVINDLQGLDRHLDWLD